MNRFLNFDKNPIVVKVKLYKIKFQSILFIIDRKLKHLIENINQNTQVLI